jgi:CheY-like chemotaxis protein
MSAMRALRILVLDDEPAVLKLMTRLLREEGHEVVAVDSCQACLRASIAAHPAYDLVITNTPSPDLSGTEHIQQLQRLFPGLPILHLDDLSLPYQLVAGTMTTPYVPFSLDAVLDAVDRLVHKQAAG